MMMLTESDQFLLLRLLSSSVTVRLLELQTVAAAEPPGDQSGWKCPCIKLQGIQENYIYHSGIFDGRRWRLATADV